MPNKAQRYFKSLLVTRADVIKFLGIVLLCGLTYAGLVLTIGDPFLPPFGPCWTLLLIWSCAHIGGFVVQKVYPQMPSLMGMLLMGVLLRNLPVDLAKGLPKMWAKEIRYGCLAIIFLSSGLEQDVEMFKRVGFVAVRLLLIPGICEALISGFTAVGMFGMPILIGLALGFILKPVDPAIAIHVMTQYQKEGRGVAKGIPSLVVAAASADDLVAITFYAIFISMGVTSSNGNMAWSIASGPLNVVFGLAVGAAGALFCSATRIWNSRFKRTFVVIMTALVQMYFMIYFDFSGAGVLGSIVLGLFTALMWTYGWPSILSTGPNKSFGLIVEHHVAKFWAWIAQPLLFGIVGTAVDFRKIKSATIPKSIVVILAGWLSRMPITFLTVSRAGFTWKEKALVMLTWTPKASVQAALASAPLDRILSEGKGPEYLRWGDDILITCLFSVLICGPIGVILISIFGNWLLPPDPKVKDEEDGSRRQSSVVHSGRSTTEDSGIVSSRTGLPFATTGPGALYTTSMPAVLPERTKTMGADPGLLRSSIVSGDDDDAVDEREAAYEDELLQDYDEEIYNSLAAVEHEAWMLEVQQNVGVQESRAMAHRLHGEVAKLRQRLVKTAVADLARTDGARDFFRRVSQDISGLERRTLRRSKSQATILPPATIHQ
eukprot:jgi/Botrbrau1/6292/Bobra.0339s0003.1